MKIHIGIINDLAAIDFEKDGKVKEWSKFTREEQITLLNAMMSSYNLYSRFIEQEQK